MLSVLVFGGVLIFAGCQIGKISRDKELIQDIKKIGGIVPKYSVVRGPKDLLNDWELQCYLMRYHNISIDKRPTNKYLILRKNLEILNSYTYKKVAIQTDLYELYQKIPVK